MTAFPWADLGVYFATMLGVWLVPVPMWVPTATLFAVKTVPPWAVAGAAAIAAGLDAILDYHLVRRVFQLKTLEQVRRHPLFARAEGWVKVAPFLTVVAFASVPLPFVIVRVLLPLSGYPMARYVAAVTLGRLPRIFVVAAFGTFFDVPRPVLLGMLAAGLALGVLSWIARRMRWVGAKPDLPGPSDGVDTEAPKRKA